jgi:hypothetical protein
VTDVAVERGRLQIHVCDECVEVAAISAIIIGVEVTA